MPFLFSDLQNYANSIKASKTSTANAGQNLTTAAGGLVSVVSDTSDRSVSTKDSYTYEDARTTTYSPSYTYSVPVITISDSIVSDSANSGFDQPTSVAPAVTQSASTTQSDEKSSGVDLTSIIVPVAGIAAVGAVAYLLIGGEKEKKKK